MGYSSRSGRRPNELASKSAHSHVIKDKAVQEFIQSCNLPKKASSVTISSSLKYTPVEPNPIRHVIALDGGYSEVSVQRDFPSATICFFQFGALIFEIKDLEQLNASTFIDPADMEKLKRIQRIKLTLPVRNITTAGNTTFVATVRSVLHCFLPQAAGRRREAARYPALVCVQGVRQTMGRLYSGKLSSV